MASSPGRAVTSRLPRRYARTVASNYVTVGAQAVTTILLTPVLTGHLGRTGYGVWSLAVSVVLYLEILEFGFAKTTTRYVAHFSALGDRDGVRRTVTTSLAILAAPGAFTLVAGTAVAAAFPSLFDLGPGLAGPARVLCLLFAVDLALSIPGDTFGAALQGVQRFDAVNATLTAVIVGQAASWAIVAAAGGGLVALGVVTVAWSLAGQAARYVAARRLVPDLAVARRWFDRRLVRPLTTLSVWFFLRDVAEIVVFRLDTVVVGLVVGVPEAGIYAVAQKLALSAERAVWPATVNFFPQSAELAAVGDHEHLRSAVLTGTRIATAIAGPLCLTLGVLAGPGIDAWVGPEFAAAASVVVLLAGAIAIKAVSRTAILTLQGMGDAKFPALVFAGEGALNLLLSVLLGNAMGLEGVALATLVAAVAADLFVALPYACRRLSIGIPTFLATVVRAHLPATAAAGILGVLVRPAVDGEGVVPVALAGLAMVGIYVVVLAWTGLDGDERRRLVGAARRRAGRAVTP